MTERLSIETRSARIVVPCSRNDYGYQTVYRSFVVDTWTGVDVAGPFETGNAAMDARERIWSGER